MLNGSKAKVQKKKDFCYGFYKPNTRYRIINEQSPLYIKHCETVRHTNNDRDTALGNVQCGYSFSSNATPPNCPRMSTGGSSNAVQM